MIENMPKVGLGTWEVRKKDVKPAIEAALKAGYKHIDTAQLYRNEKVIGKSLKELNVNREELFITSKIAPFDYKGQATYKAVKRSLKFLQIEQLDLMLLHAPYNRQGKEGRINAYKNLMKAREEGLVRKIGVSNFNVEHLKEIKEATGEYPYMNQIVLSPTVRRTEVEKFCNDNGILLTGYSTLRSYFNPNPFYPGSGMTEEQKEYINELAKKYNKNAGQVLAKWSLDQGYHIIPKSTKPSRVISNFDIHDFDLTEEENEKLNSWNTLEDDAIMKKFDDTMSGFAMIVAGLLWKAGLIRD